MVMDRYSRELEDANDLGESFLEEIRPRGKWISGARGRIFRALQDEAELAKSGDLSAFCNFVAYLEVAMEYLADKKHRSKEDAKRVLKIVKDVTKVYGARVLALEISDSRSEHLNDPEKATLVLITLACKAILDKLFEKYPGI